MWRDEAYLLDMLIAARKVRFFTTGLSEAGFAKDELWQLAVIRLLEMIGEAARRVSEDLKRSDPEIPWAAMAGLRNRLIHEYFRIDLPTVWRVIQDEIPGLIERIAPLVPPEPPESAPAS